MSSIQRFKFKWKYLVIIIGVAIVVSTVADINRISAYHPFPQRPRYNYKDAAGSDLL